MRGGGENRLEISLLLFQNHHTHKNTKPMTNNKQEYAYSLQIAYGAKFSNLLYKYFLHNRLVESWKLIIIGNNNNSIPILL